jgi:hypothetical protein
MWLLFLAENKMFIEIYVDGVLVYEDIVDFEDVDFDDEDGVEYDEDGVAWWFDEEDEIWYFYDEQFDDWFEWDEEVGEIEYYEFEEVTK